MQLNCQQCGAVIPAENINLDRMIAKCSSCNAVFSFDDQFGSPEKAKRKPKLKYDVPLPDRFTMQDNGFDLTITRRWLGPMAFFLTFFTFFWDGIVSFFVCGILSTGNVAMLLFISIHLLVGIWLAYYTACLYVNKTTITVTSLSLEVKHGPLPYPGNKNLSSESLKQIYCKQRISSGRSTTVNYEVHAINSDDKDVTLLNGLDQSEQALYIEQEIERFLKIEDVPVRGEYQP
jgi:hypothetical protein